MQRWRAKAMGEGSGSALMALAATAVLVETASMVPYLGAIGIMATRTTSWSAAVLLLAGYCLVMIAPALIMTAGWVVAHNLVNRPLQHLDQWLTKSARTTTTLWVIGIVGFLLGANAIQGLGLID